MTIHNLSFTGQVPLSLWQELGLPQSALQPEGVEFYQSIGFMKAGLYYADAITAVSPRYAEEIQTPALGCGFDGLLRARRAVLHGILNGIDEAVWNPWTDAHLPARYRRGHLRGKAKCKAALQAKLGLQAEPGALLFGVVSRLTGQKGLDLLLDRLPDVIGSGAQLAVLGSGDPGLEAGFTDAAAQHPGRVAAQIGYDEGASHQLVAGSDAILVPSRFEPCGLTQMMAMRYGAVPVVSRVGGLADSVVDANQAALRAGVATGLVADASPEGIAAALHRATQLWAEPASWGQMVKAGMATDMGWSLPAKQYEAVLRGHAEAAA